MNILALIIIILTVAPIVIGLLFGLLRGWRRSFLLLILVIVAAVLSFALCGVVSNAVLDINVQDLTIRELVAEYVENALNGIDISNLVVAFVECLAKIVIFFALFLVSLFLFWAIVFPICKLFVKPGRNRDGVIKRRRLFGAIIGTVRGAIIGACFCIVLSGLFVQIGKVGVVMNDVANLQKSEPSETAIAQSATDQTQSSNDILDKFSPFIEYSDTNVSKIYGKFDKVFGWVSSAETVDANGETRQVTLPGMVDAIQGVVKMANQVVRLKDVLHGTDLNGVDISELKDIFNNLDNINGDLSDEARQTITDTLGAISDGLDLPIDFSSIDFENVNFTKEGELIEDLINYSKQDTITEEQAEEIVTEILDSNLVLPALQNSGVNSDSVLSESQKDVVSQKLDEIEAAGSAEQDKIDQLRDLLGLTQSAV